MTTATETRTYKNDFGFVLELPVIDDGIRWHVKEDAKWNAAIEDGDFKSITVSLFRKSWRGWLEVNKAFVYYSEDGERAEKILEGAQKLVNATDPIEKDATENISGFYL